MDISKRRPGPGVVVVADRKHQLAADARPGEHRLGERPAVDGKGQGKAHAGHHRQPGVGRGVLVADGPLGKALGPGQEDVVLLEGVQHGRAHHQQVAAEVDEKQRGQGQDHVIEHVARLGEEPGRGVQPYVVGDHAGYGEPVQLVGEYPYQQQGQPGQEQGMGDQGRYGQGKVGALALAPGGYLAPGDAHHGREQHRRGEQQDGVGQLVPDHPGHRLP